MEKQTEKILAGLQKGNTVVFSASCDVSYSGRAKSYLPVGDRIIMIKQDKSILVHQPVGSNPVNYMKNAVFDLKEQNGEWKLIAKNASSKEKLVIGLKWIHFINTISLLDPEKILLAGTEKDMSDMIFNNPSLISKGFRPLSREEHTKFGFIDVFGYDENNVLTVVECKRYKADFSAVSQLERYVDRVKESRGITAVKGIIAAPSISDNAKEMLEKKGFSFVSVTPPEYLADYSRQQTRIEDWGGS